MKRILILILICWFAFACKTSLKELQNAAFTLQISQNYSPVSTKSPETKTDSALNFTVSKDSKLSYVSTTNYAKKNIYKIQKQVTLPKRLSSKNIIQRNFSEPEATDKKPKNWHKIVAGSILLTSIIWLLTSPFIAIGVIGIALAGMVYLSAFTNNAAPEEFKLETPNDENEEKYPYNIYAKIAGIIFLLSIICLLTFFVGGVAFFSLGIIGLIISFIFSIAALDDIHRKDGKERGKSLSTFVLIISAIPVLLLAIFLVLVLIYGPGDP